MVPLFQALVTFLVYLQLLQHKLGAKPVVVVAAQGVLEPQDFLVPRVQLHFEQDLSKLGFLFAVDQSDEILPRLFPVMMEL